MTSEPAVGTLRLFDTTLRDGEQSPGGSMTADQKLEMAYQLDRLRVDIIEAGFPAASPGDLESVEMISEVVELAHVAALARCVPSDIEAAGQALRSARQPVLHVFVATSDIHLKHKLRITRDDVLNQIDECVRLACSTCPQVEFSAEDATRTDWDFLVEVCRAAVEAGARTINLPDTVGYVFPEEYAALFRHVLQADSWPGDIVFSGHCHDDLGLATANTIAAVQAGARQVEVTVNGIGERAGNAPLEEVVMALKTRGAALGLPEARVDARELVPSSQLLSRLTGLRVQANKSVVGVNAFAHEAGIHQDGFLKERTTYEIMSPEDVGWASSRLVFGKHSGRRGVTFRLKQLGYDLSRDEVNKVYVAFIELADRQKGIDDTDLHALVRDAGVGRASPSVPLAMVTPPPVAIGAEGYS